MIDLYTAPTPNGHKASVTLEELGLPYTVHVVDLSKGEQKQPAAKSAAEKQAQSERDKKAAADKKAQAEKDKQAAAAAGSAACSPPKPTL